MSPSDGTRRAFLLDKFRASGLPDAQSQGRQRLYAAPIQIFSMPSGFFFSAEQIEAMKRGKSIIDASQCDADAARKTSRMPPALKHPRRSRSTPMWGPAGTEPRQVTFPRLVTEKPDDDNHAA